MSAPTIDRTGCTAPRHGTSAAYVRAKCRCPDAREDHRLYYKRWREGRLYRRHVEPTGTQRRINALRAIGHTMATIGSSVGVSGVRITQLTNRRTRVSWQNAELVKKAYRLLAGVPGTSSLTRIRAAANGWPSPAAWDDDTIDDPDATPHVDAEPDPDYVDHELVARVVDGRRHFTELNDAEKAAAVKAAFAAGWNETQIVRTWHMGAPRIRKLAAGNQEGART